MNFFCFENEQKEYKYLVFTSDQKIYVAELTKIDFSNKMPNIFLHNDKKRKIKQIKTASFFLNRMGEKECESEVTAIFGKQTCMSTYKSPVLLESFDDISFQWTEERGIFTINFDEDRIIFSGYFKIREKQYQISSQNDVYFIKEIKKSFQKCGTVNRYVPVLESLKTKESTDFWPFFKKKKESNKKEPLLIVNEPNNVLYIGVVADCSFVLKFLNIREAITDITHMFEHVKQIYKKQLNIEIIITRILVMEKCSDPNLPKMNEFCWNVPCKDSINLSDRLSSFSKWRGTQDDKIAIYHLLTGCSETTMVGLAWTGYVCQFSSNINFDVFNFEPTFFSGTSATSWNLGQFYAIAHEIGHNLGAKHDCSEKECSMKAFRDCNECSECDCKGKYVMHPYTSYNNVFSPGSKREIIETLETKPGCLKKKGDLKSIEGPVCGNGIKEEGEECDCGDEESCLNDPCCLPNCKLKPNCVCSDKNDLCCQDCQIISKNKDKICRKATGMCMEDSFCDGKSAECLQNKNAKDGSICEYTEKDGSLCINGICTSRKRQCMIIGKNLNVKEECQTLFPTCQVKCIVPGQGCVSFDQRYSDGLSCYPGGVCSKGQCELTFSGILKYNWFSFVIFLIIFSLFYILFNSNSNRRRQETENS